MSKNVKELMNQLMEFDMNTPIENIQEELGLMPDTTSNEEHTIKSAIADLIEASRPLGSFYIDGENIHVHHMYKDYIYQRVLALTNILGIELEE